jgi:hypothetical protein
MPKFDIEIVAEFVTEAASADVIRKRLHNLLKENGFDEKNFEIGIKKASKVDKIIAEVPLEPESESVPEKTTKPKVGKIRKTRGKKKAKRRRA